VSGRRGGEPRRLGEILSPVVGRLTSGDDARAYAVWARAAGGQVVAVTTTRAFSRGVLTVECDSSVWANELTYLSGEILTRMSEIDPGHPVRRLRFRVRRQSAEQEETPAASKTTGRGASLRPDEAKAAGQAADGLLDERLRAAVRAALRAASGEPDDGPVGGPGRHPNK